MKTWRKQLEERSFIMNQLEDGYDNSAVMLDDAVKAGELAEIEMANDYKAILKDLMELLIGEGIKTYYSNTENGIVVVDDIANLVK